MRVNFLLTAVLVFLSCASRGRISPVEHTGFTSIASAGIGSGVGAVVGNQLGLTGEGAAVGAGAGLLSGFVLGAQLDSLSYRIERADEAIRLAERELEHVRAALRHQLYKGDHEQLYDRYPEIKIDLSDTLELNPDQITSLKLLAALLRDVSYPITVRLDLNVGKRTGILDSRKPSELINQVKDLFENEGLSKSVVEEHITYLQDQPTRLTVTVEKKFSIKPSG
ncbi:MAG: hypothetical protein QXL01_07445 [Thermoplasmatales archaeon]